MTRHATPGSRQARRAAGILISVVALLALFPLLWLATGHGTAHPHATASASQTVTQTPSQAAPAPAKTVPPKAAKPAPAKPSAQLRPALPRTAVTTYTVRAGDTLWSIARAHHTTWQKLWSANRAVIGGNPNLIYPGQQLRM